MGKHFINSSCSKIFKQIIRDENCFYDCFPHLHVDYDTPRSSLKINIILKVRWLLVVRLFFPRRNPFTHNVPTYLLVSIHLNQLHHNPCSIKFCIHTKRYYQTSFRINFQKITYLYNLVATKFFY